MAALSQAKGEGCLGMVYSRAGLGKTRTCQWYAAHNNCVYLRTAVVWDTSYTDFLAALCHELAVMNPPKRKGRLFVEAVDVLMADPRPVFIDEIEKIPRRFLDLVRDMADMSTAPFVLIGEEELVSVMKQNRRVWSRTFQQYQFQPLEPADIIIYTNEATGLRLPSDGSVYLHRASNGDFRLVRRDLLTLVQICNARQTRDVTMEMVKMAVSQGLSGKNRQ